MVLMLCGAGGIFGGKAEGYSLSLFGDVLESFYTRVDIGGHPVRIFDTPFTPIDVSPAGEVERVTTGNSADAVRGECSPFPSRGFDPSGGSGITPLGGSGSGGCPTECKCPLCRFAVTMDVRCLDDPTKYCVYCMDENGNVTEIGKFGSEEEVWACTYYQLQICCGYPGPGGECGTYVHKIKRSQQDHVCCSRWFPWPKQCVGKKRKQK